MTDAQSRCLTERKPPGTKKVVSTGRENMKRFLCLFIVARTFFFLFLISIHFKHSGFSHNTMGALVPQQHKDPRFLFYDLLDQKQNKIFFLFFFLNREGCFKAWWEDVCYFEV